MNRDGGEGADIDYDVDVDRYVGMRIRMRRKDCGLTLKSLGAKMSLSAQQLHKYERGKDRISAVRLVDLAQALDVPVQYFFDGLPRPSVRRQTIVHRDSLEAAPAKQFLHNRGRRRN